jgi:transcription initiation factor TFIIE subunit alpha
MGDKEGVISRILYEMVGNEGMKILDILTTPMTDLHIHEKTTIPVTKIRTTLNVLHKYNIVCYSSCRDENKGWFKYTWQIKEYNIENSVRNFLREKLMKLRREFQEVSQINFFKCENGCLRLGFTEAYESNFRCEKCNGVLKPVDSFDESKKIKEEMDAIKSLLEVLSSPSLIVVHDA